MKCNLGFDNRVFLTKEEWETYLKRKPVRYIKKAIDDICYICAQPATKDNPLQKAHLIPFGLGIVDLALTPDFLDADTNIVSAHRTYCNKAVEMDLITAIRHLEQLGLRLPDFLPEYTRNL